MKDKVSGSIRSLRNKKVFIDSNIIIYSLVVEYNQKYLKTLDIFEQFAKYNNEVVLSTQVLGEIFNVLSKKYKKQPQEIISKLDEITDTVTVVPITLKTIKINWELAKENNYSYYDRLILASAIENNCNILYSEDLHNNHVVEDVKIVNPYL